MRLVLVTAAINGRQRSPNPPKSRRWHVHARETLPESSSFPSRPSPSHNSLCSPGRRLASPSHSPPSSSATSPSVRRSPPPTGAFRSDSTDAGSVARAEPAAGWWSGSRWAGAPGICCDRRTCETPRLSPRPRSTLALFVGARVHARTDAKNCGECCLPREKGHSPHAHTAHARPPAPGRSTAHIRAPLLAVAESTSGFAARAPAVRRYSLPPSHFFSLCFFAARAAPTS